MDIALNILNFMAVAKRNLLYWILFSSWEIAKKKYSRKESEINELIINGKEIQSKGNEILLSGEMNGYFANIPEKSIKELSLDNLFLVNPSPSQLNV